MPIQLVQEGDVFVVQVEGELNHHAAEVLRAEIESALDQEACDFIVDMSDCTGIDSNGLETLTWLDRQCRERLGMCKMCMVGEDLMRVLAITRLENQLDICQTADHAMAELKSA